MLVDDAKRRESGVVDGLALRADGLVKRFASFTAVAGLDLRVPAGAFFGLLGPNGAGKTTTLRMVCGLLRPDAGRVTIAGADVWENPAAAKAAIGVLPDGIATFDRLTGRDLLTYHGLLRRLPRDVVRERVGQLLDVMDLAGAADTRVEHYSRGMHKKLGLAAALLHRPGLLILDEPLEGIDPVSSRTLLAVLESFRAGGGTVVISSHAIEVVEQLCDHVAIMDHGRVGQAGATRQLTDGRSLEQVLLDLVGAPLTVREVQKRLPWLAR